MSKRKLLSAASEPVDSAFGVLDKALRATGRLLAIDEDDIQSSESDIDLEDVELPESLRDPMETLRCGRHILQHGFSAGYNGTSMSENTSHHLAQAARHGRRISDDLRQRMHKDRSVARNKEKSRG